jgi:hypothetical protein
MSCLNIVWMVVSPSSSHSFGIPMIWHDVLVVRELFMADGAFPVLLDNLPIQQFSHLGRRPEFPIASWVMRILKPLHSESYCPRLGNEFPTAAGNRFVNWTVFIATEPHGGPPWRPDRAHSGLDATENSCPQRTPWHLNGKTIKIPSFR